MKPIMIKQSSGLHGTLTLPGDKSISHRAALCAGMAPGRTVIENFLLCDDCSVTLKALAALGVKVRVDKTTKDVTLVSEGRLKKPKAALFMKESGTSARIFLGLLAGQDFSTKITGSLSLQRRPMQRVMEPLSLMGARFRSCDASHEARLPLEVGPGFLKGIRWEQQVASAQVKSALLLAGLSAQGTTCVVEPFRTRDHTERMLKFFQADVRCEKNSACVHPGRLVTPGNIFVPGDISSAAFFIIAALIVKNSHIVIKDVSINPTRMGFVRVLERMGGTIRIFNKRDLFEPLADIEVKSSLLKGTLIEEREIPSLIDELPILMVAAGLAKGKTVIKGAQELKVKETDRIASMVFNLTKLHADIRVKTLKESVRIEIQGVSCFKKARLKSFSDHRTAMSMVVAALATARGAFLDDISCVKKSFPQFLSALNHLLGKQ
jgi:3-phosphoshikimate 1-carboxyvinyltransferase